MTLTAPNGTLISTNSVLPALEARRTAGRSAIGLASPSTAKAAAPSARPGRRRGFTPLTPMRQQAAKSIRSLAGHMQQTHPGMTTAQHLRDAARVLESGNEEAAQRHLRAAAFTLSPQSLMRHGLHTDDAHIQAREGMHGVHRHLLLVKDITDAAEKNHAAINRDSYGDNPANLPPRPQPQPDPNAGYGPGALAQKPTARQPGGNSALNAPGRTNSGGSDPNVADPVGPQPKGSKQFASSWDELARVIALTGDAQHRHIPGSPLIYEHGYIPLTPEAAHSHFKGKVPKGWTAPSGGADKARADVLDRLAGRIPGQDGGHGPAATSARTAAGHMRAAAASLRSGDRVGAIASLRHAEAAVKVHNDNPDNAGNKLAYPDSHDPVDDVIGMHLDKLGDTGARVANPDSAAAHAIAGDVRLESGLSRFQREEAEQLLHSAGRHLDAGDHEKAAADLDEAMRATSLRGGGIVKGSTAAKARDLRDKIRAEHPAADAGKAGDDDKWWADTMPPDKPAPKPAPAQKWEQGGMFADPDRTGTAPMFGDTYGTSGVTEPAKGVLSGPHPADKMTVAADKHAAARSLSDDELGEANQELSRRAALLGKPGQLSKGQKAVQAEMKRRGVGMSVTWDDIARVIDLVGPKGYIHDWIFVGIPGVGQEVFHPSHGHGTVTAAEGGHVSVSFDGGHSADFPVRQGIGKAPGHFEQMTDDELGRELNDSAERGPGISGSRFHAAAAEMDRRDQRAKAARVSALYAEKPKTEADRNRVYQGLVNEGEDPEEAWAHAHSSGDEDMRKQAAIQDLRDQGYKGSGFDALARAAYKDEVRRRTVMAENATNGYMLSPAGKKAGIDPYSLHTGPESRARKYASPELKEWFDQNGRPTAADFQAQLMGRKTGMKPADFYASVTWDELSAVIELSARTAQLEVTPAPYGKPGGPGLYDVKGLQHTPYFQQVVKALMEKRGMDKGRASAIAYGALRKWAGGGGNVHPEVRAAAAGALAGEKAAGATARAVHGHSVTWDDLGRVVDLATVLDFYNPGQARVPVGQAGAGQFTKGQSQQAKPDAHQQHLAHVQHLQRNAKTRAGLLATEKNDRVKAAGLIKQRATLQAELASASGATSNGQSGSTTSANATTASSAPATAASTTPAAAASTSGTSSTPASASSSSSLTAAQGAQIQSTIDSLNTQISGLLQSAKQAQAQAAKL